MTATLPHNYFGETRFAHKTRAPCSDLLILILTETRSIDRSIDDRRIKARRERERGREPAAGCEKASAVVEQVYVYIHTYCKCSAFKSITDRKEIVSRPTHCGLTSFTCYLTYLLIHQGA